MINKLLKKLLLPVFFMIGSIMYSQTVNGIISSSDGAVPGANVLIDGTTTGTVTDFDGNYTISAKEGDVLVFSFVGYITQQVNYSGQSTINVLLEEDSSQLDEVVIIGYGKSVKKEDLTGAISIVGIKDLEKSPLLNVDQALQGRVSGVQLTQGSGAPGAGLKVRVRGSNSITGSNSPLVVVDGLIDVDINSVNPSDIKSISVLKDASSTAIYGNRGANGVIIITTKKGTKGKTIVEFGSFVSFSDPSNTIDLLSAAEFIEYANIKNIATGSGPIPVFDSTQKINDFIANSVDYQDAIYRTAVARNNQLSFRGGTDKMNYFVSGNYLDQEGIAINSNFKRYSLRSNINANISDKLSLVTSLNLIRQEGLNNNSRFGEQIAIGGIGFDPVTPIFNSDGGYNTSTVVLGGIQSSVIRNPVFLANKNRRENITNRVQTNVQLNYKLLKNLDLNISGGLDYANLANNNFVPAGNGANSPTKASQSAANRTKLQYALRLTYDNTFDEKHNINASAIIENRSSAIRGFNANGSEFFTPSSGFDNLGLADLQTISSEFSKNKLNSVIGRAIYNYDSKYLATASIRYDESSRFINNKSAVFPSFALGWNINKESFFNSQSISLLRLRAGWGLTGNENIGNVNGVLNLLGNNPWIPNGGGTGSTAILPGKLLGNPDLSWETTIQTNIGLDVGLLNNRINLSIEYYQKNTEDLILKRSLPQYIGRTSQFVNAGEVENKGIDISLSGTILRNDNFSWNASANFSSNKNKVLSLVDNEDKIFPNLRVGPNPAPAIVQVGKPIGSFYGFVFEGVDETNGNAIYATENDIIGDPNPDFTFGFNNNFSYKNFDLNFFIQGVQGNDIFNEARSLIIGRSGRIPFGTSVDLRNSWTSSNTTASQPSLNATNTQILSSEFIEDGSFIRLKNISLGYMLKNVNALESIGIESLRLYASAQNLLTLTNYSGVDPEVSTGGLYDDRLTGIDQGALPTSKTFTLGLNLKF